MISRRLAVFALFAALAAPSTALADDAAKVTRIQGKAEAVGPAGARVLAAGDPVRSGERVRTHEGARIQLLFADGMDLTLGDKAEMSLDAFVWTPASNQGKAELALVQGAFLVETGKVGKLPDHPLVVKTPVASVGVRGTKFWGGQLDNPLSVLLLEGRVVVTSKAGSVELGEPGQGTHVTGADSAPAAPGRWSESQVKRAFATVTFN